MAFSGGTALAITRRSGRNDFFVDRQLRVKIIPFTKLTGDTTSGNVDTLLTYCKYVEVYKLDGTQDTAPVATAGWGNNGGTFTTSLTGLSTGYTSGYLYCFGSTH